MAVSGPSAKTLSSIADMLETIERQGDAQVKLSADMRRLLVQSAILARREAQRPCFRCGALSGDCQCVEIDNR